MERIGIKKNAYIIYKKHRIDDADIISGYMELPKAVTMAEVTNIGKGNFTFSVRIKSRSDVRKSYQSEFSVEILGKNGDKQWRDEYNVRLYAVVSMKGETRKTHMHRPLPSMEALSKSSMDDISLEVGNKFKQDKLATERRRMNRANYSIFDSSKTYDDFLSEAEDILDIDRYGISWGLGKSCLNVRWCFWNGAARGKD